jgi:hypothetical protein
MYNEKRKGVRRKKLWLLLVVAFVATCRFQCPVILSL